MQILGTCSCCGGRVIFTGMCVGEVPHCESCGAIPKDKIIETKTPKKKKHKIV
jgi:hypothetical protein